MRVLGSNLSGKPPAGYGVALVIFAALLTPIHDAIAKILGESYHIQAIEIALVRFILQTITALPFILVFGGFAVLRVTNVRLNILRGVLLAIASIAFFTAIKTMPLADAIAIFFIQPLVVTLLSVVFLQEVPDAKRITAVLVGFVGAIAMIQPNFSAFGIVAVLPLICALLFAIYLVLGRHLSKTDSSLSIHFYTGLGGSVFLGLMYSFEVFVSYGELHLSIPTDQMVWKLFVAMGLFSSLVHLMYIQAYRIAPSGILAPYSYLEIVSALILGIFWFSDIPGQLELIGIGIIIATGLTLGWIERAESRKNKSIEIYQHKG